MSGKLVGEVYEKEVDGMAQRVLLAMADHAQDDGSQCFPSMPRLAWKLGVSTRTIIRTVKDLEETGVLEVERANGRSNEYRIRLDAIPDKEPFNGIHGRPKTSDTAMSPVTTGKPVTSDAKPVTPMSPVTDGKPVTFEKKTSDISGKTSDIFDKTSDIAVSPETVNHQLEPLVNRQIDTASDDEEPSEGHEHPFSIFEAMCQQLDVDVSELPKREKGKQLAAAKRLAQSGTEVEDIRRITKWLQGQTWITSGIDMLLVEKQYGKWILAGKPSEAKASAPAAQAVPRNLQTNKERNDKSVWLGDWPEYTG